MLATWRADLLHRKGQAKVRTSAGSVLRRQLAAMGFDNRSRNRQSHSHAALLGREEWFEDLLQNIGPYPWTLVGNPELRRVRRRQGGYEP